MFVVLLLRGGKMTYPQQAFSESLPASAPAQHTQREKSLFQLLERKGTKQELSPLCPKAHRRHWYGSTTPSPISPGCFHLPEN